jgi:hypothetical protein
VANPNATAPAHTHFALDGFATIALCGQRVEPWLILPDESRTYPHPWTATCPECSIREAVSRLTPQQARDLIPSFLRMRGLAALRTPDEGDVDQAALLWAYDVYLDALTGASIGGRTPAP